MRLHGPTDTDKSDTRKRRLKASSLPKARCCKKPYQKMPHRAGKLCQAMARQAIPPYESHLCLACYLRSPPCPLIRMDQGDCTKKEKEKKKMTMTMLTTLTAQRRHVTLRLEVIGSTSFALCTQKLKFKDQKKKKKKSFATTDQRLEDLA